MKVTPFLNEKSQCERGQSLVELTLFVPIMILLLAGFVEIGFLINGYITALDSSRASARYMALVLAIYCASTTDMVQSPSVCALRNAGHRGTKC